MPKTEDESFRERIDRAMNQRLFLLNYIKRENDYLFEVEGSTGKSYNVIVSEKMTCSCIDFTRRKKICKHIIFIVCKVYKIKINDDNPNINILFNFENIDLDKSVMKQLAFGDCSICFDSTDNGEKCNTCTGVFHGECINMWLRINRNCPLCRSRWNNTHIK